MSLCLFVFIGCFYVFFNKDKWFEFNRYYLIVVLVVSFAIPLAEWPVDFGTNYTLPVNIEVLEQSSSHAMAYDSSIENTDVAKETSNVAVLSTAIIAIYWLGVVILIVRFGKNLLHIFLKIRQAYQSSFYGVKLVLSSHKTDPCSFLKYIIVNKDDYEQGLIDHDIMLHELSHTRQLHSIDVLFIEALTIVLWWNPFIWIYKLVIKTNHEYLADQAVVKGHSNANDYAHKIIDAQIPTLAHLPVNFFNLSQTKNRIKMLTQNNRSSFFKLSGKITGTVLIGLITCAMLAFSNVNSTNGSLDKGKEFVVIIDPGHGDADPGAQYDGISEKEFVLEIAKKVAANAKNQNIKIILTRDEDKFMSLKDRVHLIKKHNADMFLSIHMDGRKDLDKNGIEIYFSKGNAHAERSEKYSKILAKKVSSENAEAIFVHSDNLYVLREADCPSLLMELGFRSDELGPTKLSSNKNIDKISTDIVNALNKIGQFSN